MSAPVVRFEEVDLVVVPDAEHVWLLSTSEVEQGFHVPAGTIRSVKSRDESELVEGKHFVNVLVNSNVAPGYGLPPSRPRTMWTKRGVVRLGFLLTGERARRFRDFAEDLVITSSVTANPVSASPLELAKVMLEQSGVMLAQLVRQEELLAEQQSRIVAIEVTGSHLEHQQAETMARVDQLSAKVSRRDPDDRMLEPITPTTLGQLLVPPVSGMRANELLREVGMQWQQNGRWTATYDGRPYAVIVPVQHASGRMHDHLQWQRRVVDVLERKLARLRAIRQAAAADAEARSGVAS